MSIPTNNTETGPANSFRAICRFGEWKVQGTDNNGVWVNVDDGAEYEDQAEAEAAAEEWVCNQSGDFIGVIDEDNGYTADDIALEKTLSDAANEEGTIQAWDMQKIAPHHRPELHTTMSVSAAFESITGKPYNADVFGN